MLCAMKINLPKLLKLDNGTLFCNQQISAVTVPR